MLRILVIQDERHGRQCSLDSIDIQFAKVEVAGSNPVSRSSIQSLTVSIFRPLPQIYPIKKTVSR